MLAFTGRPLPNGPFRQYTPRSITDRTALALEIERVRAQGFAEAFEEREPGLAAVAAPVWSASGALAAIVALQGPLTRFGRAQVRRTVTPLLEHARAISLELGWADDGAGRPPVSVSARAAPS